MEDMTSLQNDLNNVIKWSEENNMRLHESKFDFLCFSSPIGKLMRELPFVNSLINYHTPNGVELEPTNLVKDLGVYISSDYQWSTNINIMVETTKNMMSWTLGVFRDRSVYTMITLYKSLIRCRLEYCCPLWDPSDISNIQLLEDIQRNFTSRIISCQGMSYWDRLSHLNLMSLQRRRKRYSIIYMWKVKNNIVPNNIDVQSTDNGRLGARSVIPSLCQGTIAI